MSGMEWTIVTAIGVCLVLLFVILEIFFPAQHTDQGASDERGVRNHHSVVPSASAHIH